MWSEVAQSCPALCDPMDCSLQGSSVHGIFQARALEWAAIAFSRRSSRPRDGTQVSRIAGRCFTVWATREAWGDIPPCFWFAFPSGLVMLSIFSCACWPSICLLGKMSSQILYPFFKSHYLGFLLLSCMSFLDISPLSEI